MSLEKEIINGKGYKILPISNVKKFNKLRDEFIKKLRNFSSEKKIDKLRYQLAKMSKFQVNELMVSLLAFEKASEILVESCKDIVKTLCGKKIFLQRRAITVFNLPGQKHRRQWPHYELMSGISPFTFTIWAPLHDLDDNDGVFYKDLKDSYELIKQEHKSGIVNSPIILNKSYEEKPIKLLYGEVLVFNPFLLHGNINFKSNLARIATSTRFQSSSKPLLQKNSDFFKYYEI